MYNLINANDELKNNSNPNRKSYANELPINDTHLNEFKYRKKKKEEVLYRLKYICH